jgi:hypothetical protein
MVKEIVGQMNLIYRHCFHAHFAGGGCGDVSDVVVHQMIHRVDVCFPSICRETVGLVGRVVGTQFHYSLEFGMCFSRFSNALSPTADCHYLSGAH